MRRHSEEWHEHEAARVENDVYLCCDKLYSSPDELLLVKWTSVFCSQNLNDPLSAAAAGSVGINTTWVEIQPSSIPWKPPDEIYKCHQISQSSLFSFSCRDLHTQSFADFRESTFLFFFREFDGWSKTVHQHFIEKSDSKSSKFNHLSFWMANNYSSASQPSTPISALKNACTGPHS